MKRSNGNQRGVGPSLWDGGFGGVFFAPAGVNDASQGGAPAAGDKATSAPTPVIQFEHDGKTYDLEDLVKGHIKNMYRSGSGDIDEMMMESFERAAKSWESKTSNERLQTVFKALRGDGDQDPMQFSKRAENHWVVQKLQGGDLPPDPIGEGNVVGKTLLYVFRCFQARRRIDWDWIKDDAKAHGHRQIHDIIKREMSAGSLESGGILVPSVMAADLIPYLEDASVVRRLGARTIEMPNGNLDFGRMNSTVTARWLGETGTVNASRPGFDEIRLAAKKLRITVIASNDLIRQSPRGVAEMIASAARQRTAAVEDLAFLRGSGTAGEPKGISNWIDSGQKFNADETDIGTILGDFFECISRVAENNHGIERGGWVMNTKSKYGYMRQTDADKNLTPLTEMLANDQLFGFPVGVTNGLPSNLGGGSDESEVYFGDFGQAMIGETLNMSVEETQEATVTDQDGNPLRLWDEDQRALRLIHEVDFALRYSTCFSMIEQVKVGA